MNKDNDITIELKADLEEFREKLKKASRLLQTRGNEIEELIEKCQVLENLLEDIDKQIDNFQPPIA
jgi:chromosome segregation ATPase